MKTLIIILLIALYVFIAWFMYHDGYKTGKEHGIADEKIRQKNELKKAIESTRLIPQETMRVVPIQAAFDLPLEMDMEEQRAWANKELRDLINKQIREYIKFYDYEDLRYCRRIYKAQLRIVDDRSWFVEKGQQT